MSGDKAAVKKLSIAEIQKMKRDGAVITSITAYDYAQARLADDAGFDVVFVGDSLGMVCLGYEGTVQVTMEEVLHHLRVVARTCKRAHPVFSSGSGRIQCSAKPILGSKGRWLQ